MNRLVVFLIICVIIIISYNIMVRNTSSGKSDNLDPRKWGPHGWDFFHSVAFGYPTNPTSLDKTIYKQLYLALRFTLPCSTCRENYTIHLSTINIDNYLGSRKELTKWTYLVHNAARLLQGKSSISEKTFRKTYESRRL
jgi:hypothetical protein